MSGTLTLRNNTILKQDPTFQDKEQVTRQANEKIPFSWIEIKDYKGISFGQHQHLEVHLDGNGIVSDQGNSRQTWFVNTKDVARID
ncbi:MAG: hypothetical protein KME46_04730 [Brasilonema angustatum HA4187-MV1]|jgi:hypothetical protein|nr:hypothetical protein [Brasilonema angustatum HA4187-MV1]